MRNWCGSAGKGRISDVEIRRNVPLWVGCIAGALEEHEYRSKLAAAGFAQVDVEPTRIYRVEDAREFLTGKGIDVDALAPEVDGKFMSAFIRAVKPVAERSCCGPACCSEGVEQDVSNAGIPSRGNT